MWILHEYQKEAVQFCRDRKRVFLALDVGLGKTAIALRALDRKRIKTLVVAPLKVVYNTWPAEIAKWRPDLSYTILHGPKKNININKNRDIYIINYDGLKWLYNRMIHHRPKPMNLICDEIGFLKSQRSVRFKALKAMLPIFKYYRFGLSATPADNGLHELWSQYYILNEGETLGKRIGMFRSQYFTYDPRRFKYYLLRGAREEIYKRIKPRTYRLEGKDYLKLPSLKYNKIKLRLPSKLQEQYDELENEFFLQDVEAFNAAQLGNKLRQFLQGGLYRGDGTYLDIHDLKIEMLDTIIEGANRQPVLAAIQYRFEYEKLCRFYGKELPVIYGGIPTKRSTYLINEWNAGRVPLLIVHPASVSHGLNLQAGGHILVWLGLPWSLAHWHQLNGRLYRQGQRKGVVINSVVFQHTIDETVWNVLRQKNATMEDLLTALKRRKEAA